MKPTFVDNRDGNTLDRAITGLLREWREQGRPPDEVCVASAYFNPGGLDLVASELRHVPRVRLLLGAEPTPEALVPARTPYDPPEPEFTRRRIRRSLADMEGALRRDRDLLAFDLASDAAVRGLIEFLRSGRIEVRRYCGHFLHAKAFCFRGPGRGLLAGSSNLTRAGLRTNLELDLGHWDDPLVGRVERWFDELWDEAEPFDLAAIYEAMLAEFPPYLVYLRVLWQLYGGEVLNEEAETGDIGLTTFQRHGVWRAKRILERYGGVLIADGVGLGKTFTAGELIRSYRERRQRVLLVCPAALRDSTWRKFLNAHQLLAEAVSYEQLAGDAQLGGDRPHLKNPLDEYALVVVDEAHNYRNPDAPTRAAVLRRLLAGRRRDVVLLTATPVNNSLWDLYHQLRYFLKADAALAPIGVISVRDRFVAAARTDPYSLSPDLLYPVIDATTVKRTRRFVKRHYENDLIRGPDGVMVPIRFPVPVAASVKYRLEGAYEGFLDRLEEVLAPDHGEPLLRLARYKPEQYPAGLRPDGGDTALIGLLRSALLKRFESSAHAFRLTVGRMIQAHEVFLAALERGKVVRKQFLREVAGADDLDLDEVIEGHEDAADAVAYNVAALRADVAADLALLREMEAAAERGEREGSPKLDALAGALAAIALDAEAEAAGGEDARQKRKVLVFSYYEDTIDWLVEELGRRVEADPRLAAYRGRMASASGAEIRDKVRRDEAVAGFAPVSSGALPGQDADRFDLLLCTDVLAEGLNLQQCRNIVNFDLPWNPMRLVQRHGRIDRIGSPHPRVFLRTFFPDRRLDDLLALLDRVRRKLAQAAASIGVEAAPIEDGATGEQAFAETREEIERLLREEPGIFEQGGPAAEAQTGEEYRQELRKALAAYGDAIRDLPWKAGSGFARGRAAGHLFCALVGDRTFLRFVPAGGGAVVAEVGACLRLIECSQATPRTLPLEVVGGVFDAWRRARRDIWAAWMVETDPANLQPKVRRLNRDAAAFLRACPPAGVDAVRLHRVLDAIETPWSRREEALLREVFEEDRPREAKAARIVELVEQLGVEPVRPPDPLPPIAEDEVRLVCWMGLTRGADA